MESLILASAYLLYNKYYSKDDSPEEALEPTYVSNTNTNSEILNRKEEFQQVDAAPSYKPPWLKQFENSGKPKVITELVHPADETNEDNIDHIRARNTWDVTARNALSNKTLGEGMPGIDSEQVRPPRIGGYDGYDDERGRNPIPRYFKFDLGEDFTGDHLNVKDAGANKGFAEGLAARGLSLSQDYHHIRPNRDIDVNEKQVASEHSVTGTWHRGQHDFTGRGQGPAQIQAKSYVKASDDPFDKRFRDEFIPSHVHTPGSSRVGSIFKGGSMLDGKITRSGVPDADIEKPYNKIQGVSLNPATKFNYLKKETDYVQQPNQQQVDTNPQTPGVSRFTKLHSTSGSVVKDSTQWTYTINVKDARNILEKITSKQQRKTRENEAKLEVRNEGVSQDNQVLRHDINKLDLSGLSRTNRGQLAAYNVKPKSDIQNAISTDRQLAHISLDTTNLENKQQTSDKKPVLFSEEERNAYKLDPKFTLERNLEKSSVHTQGLGTFKGASSRTGTSYQYNTKEIQTVNNSLRNSVTGEAPPLFTGGSEKVPKHNLKIQASFQQQNSQLKGRKLKSISSKVAKQTSETAKEAISQHPKRERGSVLPSLTADKRDLQFVSGTAKVSVRPSDGVTNRVVSVANSGTAELWNNDQIADVGGRLTVPLETRNQSCQGRRPPDLGREYMQQKQPRVQRKR